MSTSNAQATNSLRELFTDPITYEIFEAPVVINSRCGHSFTEQGIGEWSARCVEQGRPPNCPLCNEEIVELTKNYVVEQALPFIEAMNLTDEEQENLDRAVTNLREQREADRRANIPPRAELPEDFMARLQRAIYAISEVYCPKTNN